MNAAWLLERRERVEDPRRDPLEFYTEPAKRVLLVLGYGAAMWLASVVGSAIGAALVG